MKKTFQFLILAVISLLAFACSTDSATDVPAPSQPLNDGHRIPVEMALSNLNSLLAGIDGGETRSGAVRRVASVTAIAAADVIPQTRSGEAPDIEDLVYIANFDGEQGYAVLAADDRLPSVIAITETGNLTPQQFEAAAQGEYTDVDAPPILPEVARYVVGAGTGIGTGIGIGGGGIGGGGIGGGGIGGGGYIPPTTDIDVGGGLPIQAKRTESWKYTWKKGPYVLTKWTQSAPYDYFTPTKDGKHCPVGCVAVALGQIAAANYYYSSARVWAPPIVGNFSTSWKSLADMIASYKLSPGKNRYHEAEVINEESLNVASFLRGIGDAVDMDYGKASSGATSNQAVKFMEDVVGYQNVGLYQESLEEKLQTMLVDRQLPTYVRGRKGFLGMGSGHAWVVDGAMGLEKMVKFWMGTMVVDSYTENYMLYHCNFGWRGKCDGWYFFHSVFDPSSKPHHTEVGDVIDKYNTVDSNFKHNQKVVLYNLR